MEFIEELKIPKTVSHALTQETAFLLRNRTVKAHKVEIEEKICVNLLLEKIGNIQKALEKSTAASKKDDGVVKCFNCGKSGHIAHNWNQPNNLVGRKRKAEEDQANVKSNQSLNYSESAERVRAGARKQMPCNLQFTNKQEYEER